MPNSTHQPDWVKNQLASDRRTIKFKCDYPGCTKTASGNTTQYNVGLWVPSMAEHPNP